MGINTFHARQIGKTGRFVYAIVILPIISAFCMCTAQVLHVPRCLRCQSVSQLGLRHSERLPSPGGEPSQQAMLIHLPLSTITEFDISPGSHTVTSQNLKRQALWAQILSQCSRYQETTMLGAITGYKFNWYCLFYIEYKIRISHDEK